MNNQCDRGVRGVYINTNTSSTGGAEIRTRRSKRNAATSPKWSTNQRLLPVGLFACVGQVGVGIPPSNPGDDRQVRRMVSTVPPMAMAPPPPPPPLEMALGGRYLAANAAEFGFKTMISQPEIARTEEEEQAHAQAQAQGLINTDNKKKGAMIVKKGRWGLKLRVGNASLKRLLSGAIAGAVSRTAVAPLETIRTHLMVGSSGNSMVDVFHYIMQNEGWQGLFRGNGVNVIRVAPSKAIEDS